MINRPVPATLIVGMAGALLWVVSAIAISGRVYLHEPNVLIRVGEIALIVGILIYGVVNFILLCRRR